MIEQLLGAAKQRSTTAKFLLGHSSYRLDAMYLAGYAVECALKVMILSYTPKRRWKGLLKDEFRGQLGHNFDHLLDLLSKRGYAIPKNVSMLLRKVGKHGWTTEWRYESWQVPTEDAEEFLRLSGELLGWADRGRRI